jgi:hypothetical protein
MLKPCGTPVKYGKASGCPAPFDSFELASRALHRIGRSCGTTPLHPKRLPPPACSAPSGAAWKKSIQADVYPFDG